MKKTCTFLLVLCLWFHFTGTTFAQEDTTPSGIPLSKVEEFVDQYVKEYIGKSTAGANIVIIKDGKTVLSKGYGYADIEKKVPMDPSTSVLEWGSISKLFVWTSVMQLVEQGKLDLNEDIKHYLPQDFLKNLSYDEPITLLHLMNHNAGFEDYIFDLGYSSKEMVHSLEDGLKLAEPKQVYRPGEVVAYSNYTTALAAFIVECITGQDFDTYVYEHIFSQLSMNDSVVQPAKEENHQTLQNTTKGYSLLEPGKFKESTPFYISIYPSGGIVGTAEDLATFAASLLDESSPLFNKTDTLREMLSPSYSVDPDMQGIAHGFWEYSGKFRGVTHGGNTVAFSSNLHLVPEENFAVIVLSNQSAEIDIVYGLVKELIGDEEVTVLEENLPNATQVEGTYLTARRMEHGMISLYYYLIPYKITAVQHNEIEVSAAGMKATYKQIKPYAYKMTSGHTAFAPTNTMYFHMDKGNVQKISMSISDFVPLPKYKTIPWLVFYACLALLCILFFVIAPIVLLIAFIKKRKKTKARKWSYFLHTSSLALLVNIGVLAYRMLTNASRGYSEVFIHIVLNYVFSICSLIAILVIVVSWKKLNLSKIQKIMYPVSMILSIILIALLYIWNFY